MNRFKVFWESLVVLAIAWSNWYCVGEPKGEVTHPDEFPTCFTLAENPSGFQSKVTLVEEASEIIGGGNLPIGKTDGCAVHTTEKFVYWATSNRSAETRQSEREPQTAGQGGNIAYCDNMRATIYQYSPDSNAICPILDVPHRVQSISTTSSTVYWSGGMCTPREGTLNPNSVCRYSEQERKAECFNSNDDESFGGVVAENDTLAATNYESEHGVFTWNREWRRRKLRGVGKGFARLVEFFAGRIYWVEENGDLFSKTVRGRPKVRHGNLGDDWIVATRRGDLLVLKSKTSIFKLTLPSGSVMKVADIDPPIPFVPELGAIAIHDDYVYWTRGGDNQIRRIRLDGFGAEEMRAFDKTPCGVAAFKDVLVYIFDDGRIFRTNFDGFR